MIPVLFLEGKMSKTASVKAENDTDVTSIMDQVNKALAPHGLTFEYDEDKHWEDLCACAWQLKPTEPALTIASKLADFITIKMIEARHLDTLEVVKKFLMISGAVATYQNRIVEFGIFPINHSYPNGTMMACHSVELQFQMQPPLIDSEAKYLTDVGFRVGKSDMIDDATVAIIEMNWS